MSDASDDLARRIRATLGLRPDLSETRMMGGVCFMLSGHMVAGPLKDGRLLVRVGKENYEAALMRPGAGPMTFTGRPMSGFVEVAPDDIEDDAVLSDWLALAESFVRTLPPKEAKVRTPRARKAPATH